MDYQVKLRMRHLVSLVVLTLTIMASSVFQAQGYVDGACWADPMNNLVIKPSLSLFPSNKAGATGKINFSTNPAIYSGLCYSLTPGIRSAPFFRSDVNLMPSSEKNWFILNNEVEYQINISFPNYSPTSPFKNLYLSSATAGANGVGISQIVNAWYGNSGFITFRLRRDVIGGGFIIPGGVELANLFRYASANKWANTPIYRLITETAIMPIPVVCGINGGRLITVQFDTIDAALVTTRPETTPYKKNIALNYSCNTTVTQDIKINLISDKATFSADAIKTTNADIGVVMQHNGVTVPPMGSFASRLVNNVGNDNVTFSVITRPTGVKQTGPFTGNAVLLITSL
ncbi:fimbrial protein [Erwinia sp. Eh17-17]|jgi:type 1 fimbria pilin|uniref:fimbrial protein n=1 Tax=Erwinia sp. Eh17-17 TaxID=3080330 RepID=UPI00320B41BC